MISSMPAALFRRQEESIEEKFLRLMQDPFGQKVDQDSIVIAIGTSLAITSAIFLAFCILRPFNAIVYAPRVRHTDEKHRPPEMGKSVFAWYKPVFTTREDEYVEKIGLDATIFLRVARMCRNMFAVLAIVGCAIIIPINITQNGPSVTSKSAILLMTPIDLNGRVFWWFIGVAYLFDIIVCAFLWWTYRAVHRLRRKYMESPDYQNSLHSRTLMITDINRNLRSDKSLLEIVDNVRTCPEVPRASIGRNVKDIPDLIEQHEKAVMDLEKVLAKYLKNPNKLPATRPLCKPSKDDLDYTNKNEKVDAITYLTSRIERLEAQIKEVRETVDRRDAMPYGFVSYENLESAHMVAFAARNKHPMGTTVNLAPRPKDVIWKNLPLDAKTRRWKRLVNNLWITLLTVLYFIPNALIAVFLAKLNNLAQLWDEFDTIMERNPKFWALVQGLAAPAITSLFYYFLPIIFRRLSVQAGDLTKTSRERHVIHQLYAFFVFNNLFIFSLFAAAFSLVTTGIATSKKEINGRKPSFTEVIEQIHPFQTVMTALCNISTFWVTWLVQRNLGAAIDLGQFVNLAWGSFSRKFLNPTPRELIKRTAPPPFDYASYYNYFLFYSTVALCFASLQPITLAVTAFYFTIDASMKKYLLMYVFCTKNESGGLYWRVIYNRFLVGVFLSNCIIALMVGARGGVDKRNMMLAAMIPLPLLLIAFKFYCRSAFDGTIKYYTKGDAGKGAEASAPIDKETRRRDRVAVRFGHPALFQKLTVPMVHEKSKHLLSELYRGRLDGDVGDAGYSDVYMKRMSKENPGKSAETTGPFEFVSESNMDFENFKNRPEFSDDHGGEGSIYGMSLFSRPDTPNGFDSRPGTPAGSVRGRSVSRESERTFADHDAPGVTYPAGYHSTPSHLREFSPSPDGNGFGRLESNQSNQYQAPPTPLRDETALLSGAAPMGGQTGYTPYSPDQDGRQDYFRK